MKHRFTTATALLFAIGLAASSPVLAQSCSNPDIKALVAKEWAARMPDLQSSVQSGMQHGAPDEYLYTTQVLANNLLHMAIQCNNKTMVSELAAILVLPATLRVKVMDGNWFDASGHYVTNPLPTVEWVYGGANCGGVCGHDAHLPTVQFMYMISEAIEYISSLNPLDRTIQLKFLYEAYVKMLVHDHILRWGPIYGSADIFEFGLALPPIPYYAVQDKQVFLIATAARVLSANINTGHNLLTVAESEILTKFVRDGIALLEKRTVYPQLQNGSGASVSGYSFDPYYGLDPTDGQTKYAGYTGTDSPVLSNPPVPEQRVATLSWDISHGRRFVHYLLTMRSLTSKLGLQQSSLFNTKAPRDMANQVAFKLFNGNPQYPLFANYLDGTQWMVPHRLQLSNRSRPRAQYDVHFHSNGRLLLPARSKRRSQSHHAGGCRSGVEFRSGGGESGRQILWLSAFSRPAREPFGADVLSDVDQLGGSQLRLNGSIEAQLLPIPAVAARTRGTYEDTHTSYKSAIRHGNNHFRHRGRNHRCRWRQVRHHFGCHQFTPARGWDGRDSAWHLCAEARRIDCH